MNPIKDISLSSLLQSDYFRRMMMVIGFLAPAIMTSPAFSASCRVVSVTDAETLSVRCGEAPESRVRLAEISIPESDAPLQGQARQRLAELVSGRLVDIEAISVDADQRVVAQVYRGYLHINAALVADGMAWCDGQYQRGHWCRMAEAGARIEQRGIWNATQSAAPWQLRKTGDRAVKRETSS